MAARRLLIVMLILLGISSVIAFVVPEPQRNDPATDQAPVTGTTGSTGVPAESGATGKAGTTGEDGTGKRKGEPKVSEPEAARSGGVPIETVTLGGEKPARIEAEAGTRMIITVRSGEGSDVEIEDLGLAGFADPYAPAVFDVILPPEPGRYPIGAPGEKPSAVIIASS
ncbi:MAG: hypothetical protein U0R29_05675 [Solirubrobacterales bacterium]|jgi:hypothetical protein